MERLKAKDEWEAGDVPDGRLYDVVLKATGNAELAAQALTDRKRWRQDTGRAPSSA